MRRLTGALLRRLAERVDPQPKPTMIHMMRGSSDLTEKIRTELKRLERVNGMGRA